MSNENNYGTNETPDYTQTDSANNSYSYETNNGQYTNDTQTDYNNTAQGSTFYSPVQEPPKKKKKWPVVVGVASAVVIAGGAAGAYWFFFRTPSFDTPTEAITTCMSQLGEQFSSEKIRCNSLEKKLDSAALMEALTETGGYIDGSLTLEDSSISELSMINGMSFGFSMANDVKNESASASINASLLGMGGDLQFYADSDKIALTSKEFLPDSYLSLSKEELADALKSSLSEEEVSTITSLFEQQGTQALNGLTDFSEYAVKQLPDALVSFAKDWDIKESDEKDSVKIGSEKYDCYSYEVSISAKDFQKFVDDYCSYLSDYDFEGNSFFSMIEDTVNDILEEDVSMNDLLTEILSSIPDELGDSEEDTLDLTLHLSPDAELLGLEYEIEDDSDFLNMSMLFGGENPGQECYFTMDASIDGEKMEYALSSTMSSEDDVDTNQTVLSFVVGDEASMDLTATSTYHADDDRFESAINASVDADGEQVSFDLSMDGAYKDIEKGKGYSMSFDTLSISAEAEDESYSLEFSGDMSFGALKDAVEEPNGKEYHVLNLTETDLGELLTQLKKNTLLSSVLSDVTVEDITSLVEDLMNNLSSDDLEEDLTEDLEDAYEM